MALARNGGGPRVDFEGPFFSIDVECVATGPQHNQRAVAQIALVRAEKEQEKHHSKRYIFQFCFRANLLENGGEN